MYNTSRIPYNIAIELIQELTRKFNKDYYIEGL